MEQLHKRIIEKLFDLPLEDDELIYRPESPKSGLSFWVGYSKNLNKSIEESNKLISWLLAHPKETNYPNNSISLYNFTQLVISESEDNAIKAMKRIKRHRDWNMFEINKVIVDGVKYTVVWD